ncbi:MAG: CTP synthase [Abditibacteriota bacterium]|nr:CTP synthase [Abditibacteriota bacterium]
MNTKYIFVTGGVVSSVGKGICTATMGRLFKSRGLKVSVQKFDPYINIDAGMLTPIQHGEIFITEDGAQGDLDLGHYERFVDINTTLLSDITTGIIYDNVIKKERQGAYKGGTVQVIPHITNEIIETLVKNSEEQAADISIVEIGGTVGDMEGLPYLEAIRQFKKRIGFDNVINVHLTLIPSVGTWNELKTKPTQHSVIKLRELGIQPDILVCRTKSPISSDMKDKISLFCDVPKEAVIESCDVDTIYEIPLIYEKAGVADYICKRFGIEKRPADLKKWTTMIDAIKHPKEKCNIAIVGKYVENGDAYLSLAEACKHGAVELGNGVNILWVDTADFASHTPAELLKDADAIIVAPGFGERGAEAKIQAVRYARENNIPFLGIAYGMQLAAVETARNLCGLDKANSIEVDSKTPHPIVCARPSVSKYDNYGPCMRLGSFPCRLEEGSVIKSIYGSELIYERHRHRYDLNNKYKAALAEAGMLCTGFSPDNTIVEVIERRDHPFFVGVSYNPEYKSRPDVPHPLFLAFIKKAFEYKHGKQ